MKKIISVFLSSLLFTMSMPVGVFAQLNLPPMQPFGSTQDTNRPRSENGQLEKNKYMTQQLEEKEKNDQAIAACKALKASQGDVWNRTEKDLKPVRDLTPGSRKSCNIIRVTDANGNQKKDYFGNDLYSVIYFNLDVDPLMYDEVKITYKGKSSAASMIAISRDLINFENFNGKTGAQIRADILTAASIMMAMANTSSVSAAIEKLSILGAMLISSSDANEKKAGIGIIKYLAAIGDGGGDAASLTVNNTYYAGLIRAGKKDYRLRTRAMIGLGMIGSVLPAGIDLAEKINNYLYNKAVSNANSKGIQIGDDLYVNPREANIAASDSFQVRIAAIAGLAAVGTPNALGDIKDISSYVTWGRDEDYNEKTGIYFPCKPSYDSRSIAVEGLPGKYNSSIVDEATAFDAAANDGAIQCIVASTLSDFLPSYNPNATESQTAVALALLKDMAGVTTCDNHNFYNYVLTNNRIHALRFLYNGKYIASACLKPIADAVDSWNGNDMKLPCAIVQEARAINGMDGDCESQMLYHQAITFVLDTIKEIAIGIVVGAGIGAATNGLRSAAQSCFVLMRAIDALEATKMVYGTYSDIAGIATKTAEMADIVKKLALRQKAVSK